MGKGRQGKPCQGGLRTTVSWPPYPPFCWNFAGKLDMKLCRCYNAAMWWHRNDTSALVKRIKLVENELLELGGEIGELKGRIATIQAKYAVRSSPRASSDPEVRGMAAQLRKLQSELASTYGIKGEVIGIDDPPEQGKLQEAEGAETG